MIDLRGSSGTETTYRFSDVELDVAGRRVLRRGQVVSLQRKPLDLLVYLVRQRQRVVSKNEILDELWRDESVGENSLAVCITKIRKAVGDDIEAPQIIQTVHGYGYRFIAPLAGQAAATDVVEHNGAADPLAAALDRPAPRIVGRAAELGALHVAWARALSGQRQVTFVTGESGMGKTMLVQAFVAAVADGAAGDTAALVLWGDCVEQHSGVEPFMPLLDACARACRGANAESVVRVLHDYAPAWLLQLPGVLSQSEREQLRAEWSGLTPERLLRMLADAFAQLAAVRPLIVVLDDLHWSDGATIDVLARIAHDPSPARLLLIGTYRPADAALRRPELTALATHLHTHRRCDEIPLHYRDASAIPALVAAYFESVPAARERCAQLFNCTQEHRHGECSDDSECRLQAHLFERTRGQPLFVHAVLNQILSTGKLGQIPDDVGSMIEHEIDALSAGEQRALEVGSLVGVEFAVPLIAAALDVAPEPIEDCLFALARRRRIIEVAGKVGWPDGTAGGQYRFVHPLYPEVLAARVAPTPRRAWHHRIGGRLATAYGDPSTTFHAGASPGLRAGTASFIASTIARHFEHAGDAAASIEYYQHAIAAAQEELAYQRIAVAAAAALALLDRQPPSPERARQVLTLRVALGPALVALKGYPAAEVAENCERVIHAARELGEAVPLALSLLLLAAVQVVHGAAKAALMSAQELESLAEVLPAGMQHIALGGLGQVLTLYGESGRGRGYLERAAAIAEDEHSLQPTAAGIWMDPAATFATVSALALTMLGYPDQGRDRLQRALARARRLDHPISLATVQMGAALLYWLRRDNEALAGSSQETCRIATAQGLFAPANHVRVLGLLSQAVCTPTQAHAEELLHEIQTLEKRGIRVAMTWLRCFAAETLGFAGQPKRGLAVLDEALAQVERGGERFVEAEIHRLRGELLWASGKAPARRDRSPTRRHAKGSTNIGEAEAAVRRAIAVAQQQNAKWWELRATVSLCRMLQAQGQAGDARDALADIYGWFTEGFDTPDLQMAQSLLRELGG